MTAIEDAADPARRCGEAAPVGHARVSLTFLPAGKSVRVPSGVSVFDAALWNGVPVDSTCGGHVTCKTCKSPDTLLTKENRIFFMSCESCGSRRSVNTIKTGFQAQVGKRSKNKTG